METAKKDISLLKRAYLKIEELEARLQDVNQRTDEAIAVVGMGCRFPGGVRNPESYWKLLLDGKDAIDPIPSDRWDAPALHDPKSDTMGKIYVDCGGFLREDISRFDPHFFGISQREAVALDPQQRMLLETTWEAIEHAGINPDTLSGSRTGVFLGIASTDYKQLVVKERNAEDFNLYYLTGNALSTASGRLSYFLGLNGPSMTVDTACSASLTAVHLSCQSLRTGECEIALAGGVNLVLSPEDLVSYCSATMLSPTGRCKSFDSAADGFILSEGCGIILLKRLSKAVKDGDTIYAIIRSSQVNQDGASNGLTAPNSPAQQKLISDALNMAKLSPSDIGYIEAHGSGTPLGDPIEVQALASVFGKRDSDDPLILGCVKTNIGHCAAAAGIAGLIKTILALHYKKIPRNLHFKNPNPMIPWDDITAIVPTETMNWNPKKGTRRAGVSSFGVSGTNAHIILEEAPSDEIDTFSRKWKMLPLSAKTETALVSMIQDLNTWMEQHSDTSLADVAYTLQTGRKSHKYRCFFVGRNTDDIKAAILSNGETSGGRDVYTGKTPKLFFVFPGQGTQYPGMGAEIYEHEPVFRREFDRCAESFEKSMDEDIRRLVFTQGDSIAAEKLKDTYYAQPIIFSLEYALGRLWQSWGVEPAALVGHSIGEFAAACISGIMTLEDGAFLVAARSRLMHSLPAGAMVSVRSLESDILPKLLPELSIAAVNSPGLCVVSGPFDAIDAFKAHCEAEDIVCRPLHTSHAFHSAMVEPALPDFEEKARSIKLSPPKIPIMSTATGSWLGSDQATDPQYWTKHMRLTVRFSDAIKQLIDESSSGFFLEVGSRATSTTLVRQQIRGSLNHWAINSMSSTGEPDADLRQLIMATGFLWLHGVTLDQSLFYRNEKRFHVTLPTYPFERQQYWINQSTDVSSAFRTRTDKLNPVIEASEKINESIVSPSPSENTVDEKLKKIIAVALGCAPGSIDTTATFLNLGVDSLLMRQFSQQIKTEFGINITVRQLMREYSTISKLSSYINQK
ncbi:MAG: acyltransferase domain-containing protein [Candidatus Latescibacteria bacterium]|nr:acyltransferase domain-containing protein [Candidatus Latescibacterota bacterium]